MRLLVVAALCLALAACGGTTAARSPSVTPSRRANAVAAAKSVRPSSSEQSAAASPGSGESPNAASEGQSPKATLQRTCVHQGATTEIQGLNVSAKPKTTVGYSTEYSDHSNEVSNKAYTSGFGYGTTDAQGRYRATWTIPPTAPAGVAIVHIIVSPGSVTPAALRFQIVGAGATCS